MSDPKISRSQGGNPLTYLFAKTWQYSIGNRIKLGICWAMFIFAETIQVLVYPLIWARIMNVVQVEGITKESINSLLWMLGALLLATITFWFIHGPARLLERSNAFKVRLNYRKYLLRGVMTYPMDWHSNNQSGDTIDKVEKGTSGLYSFSEETFEVIYSIVRLLISYCMLFYFFSHSSYIVLAMMIVMFFIVTRFDRVLIKQYKELNKNENQVTAKVFDSISNITTVIILRVEKLVFDAIIKKAEEPYKLFIRNNNLNELKWFLTSACCTTTVIVVMGAYFVSNIGVAGGVLIGNVWLLYRYLGNITEIFSRFTHMYGGIVKHRARVANSEELMEQSTNESFSNHVLPTNWKELRVQNLNFTYGEGTDLNLKNIELTLKRGEKIAFIGKSGSGKTTCLRVMRDLYHPQSLSLYVDGVKIDQGFDGISRAIALVPQSPEIFASTILENLTLGAEYSEDFIRRFTNMACFTEVALALPNKFDSTINEKGVNLSGGQQQRLALARGLIASSDKDIVLLDEPTSSLDADTERRIYENLLREFGDKTIVSSVHRLHLLPLFDRIVMFDDGRIVGSGTFEEMPSGCTEFQDLWRRYEGGSGMVD